MEVFTDPTIFGAIKVVGITILFIMAIPFIIGAVLGWFIRGMTS